MTDPTELGAGKPSLTIFNKAAPAGMYRVGGWRIDADNKIDTWIEGDFADRAEAIAAADALKAAGAHSAAVYNQRGNSVASVSSARPDFELPTSVSRLCGLHEVKAKRGSHNRKR